MVLQNTLVLQYHYAMLIGYARVSTNHQDTAAQVAALQAQAEVGASRGSFPKQVLSSRWSTFAPPLTHPGSRGWFRLGWTPVVRQPAKQGFPIR